MRWNQIVSCIAFICIVMLSGQGLAANQQSTLLLTDTSVEVDISVRLSIIEDAQRELTLQQAIILLNERGKPWTARGFPLSLTSADNYQSNTRIELLGHGLYLGMFAMIAIFSLLMSVSTRDSSYLMFALLLIFGVLHNLSFHGIAAQFLWPSSPRWADISISLFISLASAAGLQFSRTFLNIAALNRSLDKMIIGLIGVTLLFSVLTPILPGMVLSTFVSIILLLIFVSVAFIAVLGVKQGNRQARYFAAAFLVLLLGVFIEWLQRMGINLPFPLNYHAIKVSAVASTTILSLGLSDRVKELLEKQQSVQENLLKASQQKIETLQRADELKEEFIANGSYALKAPLNGIIGLSDIMPGQIVSGKGRRILVVDDDYLNLRILQEHLVADYELILALSAHEALEIIETNRPELIITDLMMPVMDGFELCAAIRKKYRLDELPIIILTARNRVEDLVQGLSAGANDYISKPFSKEELKIRINKQFELLQLMEIQRENQRLYWQLEKYQETEKHLRERESRFAKMLDVTGDAMLCIDESGLIIHFNKSAENLFGVKELDYQDKSLNIFTKKLKELSEPLASALKFPFDEERISTDGDTNYFEFVYDSGLTLGAASNIMPATINVCILPLSLEQELFLLLFNTRTAGEAGTDAVQLSTSLLPEIIKEINKNVERTQILRDFLNQITPEDLQKNKHLFDDLANVDEIIRHISDAIHEKTDDDLQYRETLVKLMQDCQYYWQKVTGQSIIELAEQSRIWTVSIDNGRLRTRSMNRYLALDKLPENPRWRQVARTAYFVLSKVSHDQEAKLALEKTVTRLQDIVEAKALN